MEGICHKSSTVEFIELGERRTAQTYLVTVTFKLFDISGKRTLQCKQLLSILDIHNI